MLFRFTVMMCVSIAVIGGKIEIFVRETSRSFVIVFFAIVFAFYRRKLL